MLRFSFIAILVLMASSLNATFELQDPAAQIYEEEKEQDNEQTTEALGENTFCVIEMNEDQCFCIHKETKDRILLEEGECMAILSQSEDINP